MKDEVHEEVSFEDDFKVILDDHGNRINKLEIDNAFIKEKLNSISVQMNDTKDEVGGLKSAVARLETTVLTTNNSILTTLTQVVTNTSNNQTQVVTTKNNNRTQIIIKVLTIVGACVAGFLASKYGFKITL